MRRDDRAQDRDFSLALIDRCTHGVMALSTGEPLPYCLPLSFVRIVWSSLRKYHSVS